MKSLCVYCGSRSGRLPIYTEAARQLGHQIAERQIELIYGGGRIGLMGILADAVLEAGGRVQGVIPLALADLEVAHRGLTRLHVVQTMHERKSLMADLSEGFMALPGGIGTLEELFEIWTWAQLGIHRRPIGLLNVAGYFDRLLAFLDHTVAEQFLKPVHHEAAMVGTNASLLLDRMMTWEPVIEPKVISPEAR